MPRAGPGSGLQNRLRRARGVRPTQSLVRCEGPQCSDGNSPRSAGISSPGAVLAKIHRIHWGPPFHPSLRPALPGPCAPRLIRAWTSTSCAGGHQSAARTPPGPATREPRPTVPSLRQPPLTLPAQSRAGAGWLSWGMTQPKPAGPPTRGGHPWGLWPPAQGRAGATTGRPPSFIVYCLQIFQITPVPGIWTSGASPGLMNLLAGSDWPKSRTAP